LCTFYEGRREFIFSGACLFWCFCTRQKRMWYFPTNCTSIHKSRLSTYTAFRVEKNVALPHKLYIHSQVPTFNLHGISCRKNVALPHKLYIHSQVPTFNLHGFSCRKNVALPHKLYIHSQVPTFNVHGISCLLSLQLYLIKKKSASCRKYERTSP
jgi:hypothetical protein